VTLKHCVRAMTAREQGCRLQLPGPHAPHGAGTCTSHYCNGTEARPHLWLPKMCGYTCGAES
jgi:hypothetical protein